MRTYTHTNKTCICTHEHAQTHTAPPPTVEEIDFLLKEHPEVVPQTPEPIMGDDGITEDSVKVTFSLPPNVDVNGPVDR